MRLKCIPFFQTYTMNVIVYVRYGPFQSIHSAISDSNESNTRKLSMARVTSLPGINYTHLSKAPIAALFPTRRKRFLINCSESWIPKEKNVTQHIVVFTFHTKLFFCVLNTYHCLTISKKTFYIFLIAAISFQ